jgi:hypothetical protein
MKKSKKRCKKKKIAGKSKPTAKELTDVHKRFCELYASDREYFGNGVQAYAKAYCIDLSTKKAHHSARTCASRLLTNVDILAYINKLLDDIALNEAHVDKQLAFLITQNADFGAKMAAIREFNALRQRITNKFEGTVVTLTGSLLDMVDGASKGKIPEPKEKKDAGK